MKPQLTVTNEVMRTKTDHKKIAELIGRGWTDFQIYKNSGWSFNRIADLREKLLLHAETKEEKSEDVFTAFMSELKLGTVRPFKRVPGYKPDTERKMLNTAAHNMGRNIFTRAEDEIIWVARTK